MYKIYTRCFTVCYTMQCTLHCMMYTRHSYTVHISTTTQCTKQRITHEYTNAKKRLQNEGFWRVSGKDRRMGKWFSRDETNIQLYQS